MKESSAQKKERRIEEFLPHTKEFTLKELLDKALPLATGLLLAVATIGAALGIIIPLGLGQIAAVAAFLAGTSIMFGAKVPFGHNIILDHDKVKKSAGGIINQAIRAEGWVDWFSKKTGYVHNHNNDHKPAWLIGGAICLMALLMFIPSIPGWPGSNLFPAVTTAFLWAAHARRDSTLSYWACIGGAALSGALSVAAVGLMVATIIDPTITTQLPFVGNYIQNLLDNVAAMTTGSAPGSGVLSWLGSNWGWLAGTAFAGLTAFIAYSGYTSLMAMRPDDIINGSKRTTPDRSPVAGPSATAHAAFVPAAAPGELGSGLPARSTPRETAGAAPGQPPPQQVLGLT